MTAQILLQTSALRPIESAHANDQPPMMERAGAAAAELALTLQNGLAGPPLIFAGPGNNGGDAFVVARILKQRGLDPVVVFLGQADKLPADARKAWGKWVAIGSCLSRIEDLPDRQYGLLIDGLFGIGLSRPLAEPWLSLIARINDYRGPVLAIDCPSGLNTDTGTLNPIAVRATHTITFIAHKPGLLTLDGPDHCGEVTVADIGLGEDVRGISSGFINDPQLFSAYLKPRQHNTHKGNYGNSAIIGGAPTMAGAALLAGRAALKLGAGRIYVGMLERVAVDYAQPELMIRPANEVLKIASAAGIGPGLGQSGAALDLLRQAIDSDLPLVFDADALNLLATHPVLMRQLARRGGSGACRNLLTPHPAEAARLLDTTTDAVQSDRVGSALELARRFRASVVLKGCGSIIATAEGRWFVNATGNAGLASGGTGDVLTGFCVALLAQGWSVEAAALGAAWLHGAAAEQLVAAGEGPIGIAASELIAPARRRLNQLIAARAS